MRAAAREALGELLEPLAGFAHDAGLSVHEVETLLRIAAVRSAAKRQREVSQRVNISGIAASTGLSRAEISRILESPARAEAATTTTKAREQQATNRILSAWHEDPQFTKSNGQPAELKIFGAGATFDALVKQHGRGLPTRAMLDELARVQALEVLPGQKVRAKALVAADRGASPQAIKAFGQRAEQLLSTLLATMRDPDGHQFVTHIEGAVHSVEVLKVLQTQIASAVRAALSNAHSDGSKLATRLGFVAKSQSCGFTNILLSHHSVLQPTPTPSTMDTGRRNLRRGP